MNVLCWNTNRKLLHKEIYNAVEEHEVNLLILIEYPEDNESLNIQSNLNHLNNFELADNRIFKKAKILFTDPISSIEEVHGHPRYGVYKLHLNNSKVILCGIVHFPSKLHWSLEDYTFLCVDLKNNLERIEDKNNSRNTFLIGDFNMNPFESGLISAGGLNNISIKSIAKKRLKKIYGKEYRAFYNPMWNFFGEFSRGTVPGTHYYDTSRHINFYWNMYDQIMVRPELLNSFEEEKFQILCNIQGDSLLKEINECNVIDKAISDHLPIFANFNIFEL